MKKVVLLLLAVLIIACLLPPRQASADSPPVDPLRQPAPASSYGMDVFGPGWQWTFPREDAWPRLTGPIRVDQMDELLRKVWGAGVRHARISAWWCMLEPGKDEYAWEDMDYALQIASNYGVNPVPQIFYTPDWAAIGSVNGIECVDDRSVRNLPPQDMNDWSDFMADMTARYGAMGRNQVHEWEIWNEPDLYEFLYAPGDPTNGNAPLYANLVKRARQEIDIYDPGGRLLFGGLSENNGPEFLRRTLDLQGPLNIRDDIDVVTFHAFSLHGYKLDMLSAPLKERGLTYELWVNELNNIGWGENVTPQQLANLFNLVHSRNITRTFWFKSWTTNWGPGVFYGRDPLWVPGPFVPNAFYDVFKRQAFPESLPETPAILSPGESVLAGPAPTFMWERPRQGTYDIAGYKLQVDNTLYRGQPYFHTPEIDIWAPAIHIQFFPMQWLAKTTSTPFLLPGAPSAPAPATATTPAAVPAIEQQSYTPPSALPPGQYFWRVAAVDTQGNVGPYTEPRPLFVSAGSERVYLSWIR